MSLLDQSIEEVIQLTEFSKAVKPIKLAHLNYKEDYRND